MPVKMVSQLLDSNNSFSAGKQNDEGSTLCFAENSGDWVGASDEKIFFWLYQALPGLTGHD